MRDRIKLIMENEHMTPSAFADKLHIGRAVMSHLLNGRNNPSLDVVTRILTEMDYIDSNWLLMGEGEMYKKGSPKSDFHKKNIIQDENDDNSKAKAIESSNLDLFSLQQKEEKIETNEKNDGSTSKPTENIIDTEKYTAENKYLTENIVNHPQTNTKYIDKEHDTIVSSLLSKKANKIIIYYNDNTFEVFEPNSKPF